MVLEKNLQPASFVFSIAYNLELIVACFEDPQYVEEFVGAVTDGDDVDRSIGFLIGKHTPGTERTSFGIAGMTRRQHRL